jgi:hypothetical protein
MNKLANQADPVQSQGMETLVSILGVISAQIEGALHETDAPAAILVETAHSMSTATQTIARCLFDFSGSPARVFQDLMVLHDDMHTRAGKAATAIQFHDRLVQCLTHVCSSLTHLAQFIGSDSAAKSQVQWTELRERVREIHSMEHERAVFDLFVGGASLAEGEKQIATAGRAASAGGAGEVELF